MRDHNVLATALDYPWAITRPMLALVATVLSRHMARAPRVEITPATAMSLTTAHEPVPTQTGVARIAVHGVIEPHADAFSDISGMASFDDVSEQVQAALADPKVTAIVLDIDSPGGAVAGATECAAVIRSARDVKHVLACCNYQCCSAAYWIAAQASELIAAPSSLVGSIGVYSIHEDLSKALDDLGIKITYISAGEFKVDGNETEPLSDTARARFKAVVDAYYGKFVADIAAGRRVGASAVTDGYGKGAVLTADEALAAGMVDRIDTIDATVARALTLSPLTPLATPVHARPSLALRNRIEHDLVALTF